jgi:hypothetical protein
MTDAPREITVEEIDEFEHWVCQIYAKSKRAKAICALARRALSQAGGEREVCKQHPDGCFVHPAPDTPQSVPTCTCSKHPLWDGYDGDCPIHGWFEPVAPDTPQSIPAAGDDELAVRAERDKLKEKLEGERKLAADIVGQYEKAEAKLKEEVERHCNRISSLLKRVSVLEGAITRFFEEWERYYDIIGPDELFEPAKKLRAALRTSEDA